MEDYINPPFDQSRYDSIASYVSRTTNKDCTCNDVKLVFDLLFENAFKLAMRSAKGEAAEELCMIADLLKSTEQLRKNLNAFPEWQRKRLYNRGFPHVEQLQSLADGLKVDQDQVRYSHNVQPVAGGRYAPAYVVAENMAVLFAKLDLPITISRASDLGDPGSAFTKCVVFALEEFGADSSRWRSACESAQKLVKSIQK